jgi:hypothetical protein
MQYLFRRFLCPPPPPPFPHAKNVFVTSKMSVGQHNTQKHFKPSPTTHKNDPFYLYSVYYSIQYEAQIQFLTRSKPWVLLLNKECKRYYSMVFTKN